MVCGNDSIARYLTQAFRKKGIRVPEDPDSLSKYLLFIFSLAAGRFSYYNLPRNSHLFIRGVRMSDSPQKTLYHPLKMLNRDYIKKIKAMGIQIYMLDNYKDEGEELLGDVVKMESFHPVMHPH